MSLESRSLSSEQSRPGLATEDGAVSGRASGLPWSTSPALTRAALVVAVLWAVGWMWHYVNVTYDDAFISFRYAENLAAGHGLVFTPGERVEGFSNFLWTVGLVPLVWAGVPSLEFGMLAAGKLAGGIAGVATLLVTWSVARRTGGPRWAWLAPVVLALQAPFQLWSVGALETLVAVLLEGLAIRAHLDEVHGFRAAQPRDGAVRARAVPSSFFWLLASLTRPEPPIYFAVCLADRWWARRDALRRGALSEELRFLAWFVLPFLAFLGFRLGYYGELLPNTYYAKMGGTRILHKGLAYVEAFAAHLGWVWTIPPVALGLVLGRKWDARVRLIAVLVGVHVLVVIREGGDWMPAARFLVPALPLLAVLSHSALLGFVDFGFARWLPAGELPSWVVDPAWVARARAFAAGVIARRIEGAVHGVGVLALLAALLVCGFASSRAANIAWFPSGYGGVWFDCFEHFELARYMNRKLPRPGLLAAGEAGVLPYYTGLPFLDLAALMDKHLARQPGGMHRKFDADYIFGRAPDYVVLKGSFDEGTGAIASATDYSLRLIADSRFRERYRFEYQHDGLALFVRRTLTVE